MVGGLGLGSGSVLIGNADRADVRGGTMADGATEKTRMPMLDKEGGEIAGGAFGGPMQSGRASRIERDWSHRGVATFRVRKNLRLLGWGDDRVGELRQRIFHQGTTRQRG